MSIWAHTLVKNEERYLWFAVTSVINWVDKVMLWDTGSTDNTTYICEILQKIYPGKVIFKEVGDVNSEEYTEVRQEMLERTNSDWFMILDGDEVWWDESIAALVDTIEEQGGKLESIVNPYLNLVGDIFHYQPESAGNYQIDDRKGHLTIRAMNRNIPGLYTSKPHGQHGYFDENDVLIQNRSKKKRVFVDAPFMHFTHLIRSSNLEKDLDVPKRDIKYKYELGIPFPKDYYYPEAFFRPRPAFIPSPWQTMSAGYRKKAALVTIPKRIKRKIRLLEKSGY